MKKQHRIKKRRDFIFVSKSGFFCRTRSFVVQGAIQPSISCWRCGLTASKRVGNAVERNLCKRRIRSAIDIVFSETSIPVCDYVFIANRFTSSASWNDLLEDLRFSVNFLNRKMISVLGQ